MQKKILVIGDDRMTRALLRTILERADYQVILAANEPSAVERAMSGGPDLVIADGWFPKIHGVLTCKAIKGLNPALKVILLTGLFTQPMYKWEVIEEYEADDLLTKPAKPADLLACVEKHLADLPPLNRAKPLQPSAFN